MILLIVCGADSYVETFMAALHRATLCKYVTIKGEECCRGCGCVSFDLSPTA
jgi:hypothetical protein